MKYCEKCKKEFSDNQIFCSECGDKLTSSVKKHEWQTSDFVKFVKPSGVEVTHGSDYDGTKDNNSLNEKLISWLPVISAALGVIVAWYISGLLGLILGVAGASLIVKQKKQGEVKALPLVLTCILAAVDVILWFIATIV